MKRVAIIGAECSGKTTLAYALHKRLGGIMLKESLRLFCEKQGRTPLRHEQKALMLSMQQPLNHIKHSNHYPYIWCDTSALQTAIYSLIYFADNSLLTEAIALQAKFDFTCVCNTVQHWQTDTWRDGFVRQRQFHRALINILQSRQAKNIKWQLIQGEPHERIATMLQVSEAI